MFPKSHSCGINSTLDSSHLPWPSDHDIGEGADALAHRLVALARLQELLQGHEAVSIQVHLLKRDVAMLRKYPRMHSLVGLDQGMLKNMHYKVKKLALSWVISCHWTHSKLTQPKYSPSFLLRSVMKSVLIWRIPNAESAVREGLSDWRTLEGPT